MAILPLADELESKLRCSDGELYEELGLAVARGAVVGDPQERGRRLLEGLRSQLQDAVCKRASIRLLYEKRADQLFLLAAVVDAVVVVISAASLPMSPATVAVLVLRAGLAELCSTCWESPSGKAP